MHLALVILNYRTTAYTVACLRSVAAELRRLSHPPAGEPVAHVFVVENGSGGQARETLARVIDEEGFDAFTTLLPLDTNLGYAGGCNVALRRVAELRPDYVQFLNNDTEVRPGAFSALLRQFERDPHVGIVGSLLEEPDGTPQASAFRFPSPLGELARGISNGLVSRVLHAFVDVVPVPRPPRPFQVDWVPGAAMMVRRTVLEQVGWFDEDFFAYFEDVDLCRRAQRRGWTVWCVPESAVLHHVGKSSGIDQRLPAALPAFVRDARRLYFLKNDGPIGATLADAALMAGLVTNRALHRAGRRAGAERPGELRAVFNASVFARGFRRDPVKKPSHLP